MFFIISKIFWVLIKPLNFLFILMAIGFFIRIFSRKAGQGVIVFAAFFFVFLGIMPIGPNLMVYLESRYERPANLPERVDGIIVLGGAFDGQLSHEHGYPVGNSSTERIHDFIRLGKQYPDAKLLFSGGSGRPLQQKYKEAPVIQSFFKDMGVSQQNLMLEPVSRNTSQNVTFSYNLLQPKDDEVWILITSAYHMQRAMSVFETIGWNVIPYPTDHNMPPEYVFLPKEFNVSKNFHMLEIALKELIGSTVYYLSGKSSLPFKFKNVPFRTQ
jgi:uncharacterized SAM-binding protein YcdF (DUF218 family)